MALASITVKTLPQNLLVLVAAAMAMAVMAWVSPPGISNQSTVQVVPTSERMIAADDKLVPNETWAIAASEASVPRVGLER